MASALRHTLIVGAPTLVLAVMAVAVLVAPPLNPATLTGPEFYRQLRLAMEDIKYSHYIDLDVEKNGTSVQVDYSSPSAFWETVNKRYQPFYLFLAFYSFMILCYWGSGLIFIVIEQMRWLDSIKIHRGVYNTWADYWKCFTNLFLNYFMIILPALIPGWYVLRICGMSFAVEDFPSLATFLWHMWICWVGEDFFQYFFHRFLHIPWFYKNVHKLHHEYQTPFALAGSYATPYELVFLSICTFLPALLLRPHFFTFLAWILARQMDAVLEHCGYYIPNPLHVLPFYGGIVFHDYHHTGFTTNYASRFTYLDRLFGTYKEPPVQYGSGVWNDAKEVATRRLEAEGVKGGKDEATVKTDGESTVVQRRGRRSSVSSRSS